MIEGGYATGLELVTYHHADDWDQEDDLNQAVEDEKDAAEHLGWCLEDKVPMETGMRQEGDCQTGRFGSRYATCLGGDAK